jgi:hypothetical protein
MIKYILYKILIYIHYINRTLQMDDNYLEQRIHEILQGKIQMGGKGTSDGASVNPFINYRRSQVKKGITKMKSHSENWAKLSAAQKNKYKPSKTELVAIKKKIASKKAPRAAKKPVKRAVVKRATKKAPLKKRGPKVLTKARAALLTKEEIVRMYNQLGRRVAKGAGFEDEDEDEYEDEDY